MDTKLKISTYFLVPEEQIGGILETIGFRTK